MRTPAEKYMNDNEYHQLVNLLESFIHRAQFTPSELREACVFACIRYESHKLSNPINSKVAKALQTLNDFSTKET